MHFTVRLAGHDWLTWGSLQKVLLCNGFLGRVLICGHWYHRPVFRWRDILFPCYMFLESCYGDLYCVIGRNYGFSRVHDFTRRGILVYSGNGWGQNLCLPCHRSWSYSAYVALPTCLGYLGFFPVFLHPPGDPQLRGRCPWFFAILDGVEGIFDRPFLDLYLYFFHRSWDLGTWRTSS